MDVEVEDEKIQAQFNEEDVIKVEDTTLPDEGNLRVRFCEGH